MKMTRHWEQNYLAITGQIGDLIQKKAAAGAVQHDIERVHLRLKELGEAMFTSDDSYRAEQDYLAASREMHDLLQRKSQVYAIADEIEGLHGKLMDLGKQLGWSPSGPDRPPVSFAYPGDSKSMDGDAGPEVDGKLQKLQQQIEDLKTVLG
jgi:hypothetical protein